MKALSTLANFFLILCALTILFAIVKAHGIKKNLSNVERAEDEAQDKSV